MDYISKECGKPSFLMIIDVGIGKKEAYGSVTNDIRQVVLSECCEADYDVIDEYETTKEVDNENRNKIS